MALSSNIFWAWNANWALDIFIEWVALEQFETSTYFMQLWDKRTLPWKSNSYKFNKVDAWTLPSAWVISEWTTPSATDFAMTQVEVTMTQLWAFTQVSDILLSDAPTNVLEDAWREIWRLLGEKADANIQSVLSATTNEIIAWGKATEWDVTATDVISAANLAESFSRLRTNRSPFYEGSAYVAVLHPAVIHDLFLDSSAGSFVEVNKYSKPETVFSWEIGKIFWVRIIDSANVTVNVDAWATTTDTYNTFVMWERAYWVVTAKNMEMMFKPLWSEWSADPLNQRWTVWGKLRFWASILKGESIFKIVSASSIWNNS